MLPTSPPFVERLSFSLALCLTVASCSSDPSLDGSATPAADGSPAETPADASFEDDRDSTTDAGGATLPDAWEDTADVTQSDQLVDDSAHDGSPMDQEAEAGGSHALFDMPLIRDPSTTQCSFTDRSVRVSGTTLLDTWRLTYTSMEYVNGVQQPILIRGYAARPAMGSSPLPGIVLSHGLGGKADIEHAASLAHRTGMFVVSYSGPGSGDTPDTQSEGVPPMTGDWYRLFDTAADTRGSWFWAHAVAAMRALVCLETRPDVDTTRLGMTGYSAGAVATLIAAGVDDRGSRSGDRRAPSTVDRNRSGEHQLARDRGPRPSPPPVPFGPSPKGPPTLAELPTSTAGTLRPGEPLAGKNACPQPMRTGRPYPLQLPRIESTSATVAMAASDFLEVPAPNTGCFRGLSHVAPVPLEDGGDESPLELVEQPLATGGKRGFLGDDGVQQVGDGPGDLRSRVARLRGLAQLGRGEGLVTEGEVAHDGVAEFSGVAGPRVPFESIDEIRTKGRGVPPKVAPELHRQQADVAISRPQRWQIDACTAEAEQKVVAKPAGLNLCIEVPPRRRDDAHVDVNPTGAADSPNAGLVDGAQQLGLERQFQVTDLVDEQGAAIGFLEQTAGRRHRARIGSSLVSEERGFDEVRRNPVTSHAPVSIASEPAPDPTVSVTASAPSIVPVVALPTASMSAPPLRTTRNAPSTPSAKGPGKVQHQRD